MRAPFRRPAVQVALVTANFKEADAERNFHYLCKKYKVKEPRDVRKFLWRNTEKFVQTGSVANRPGRGRRRKVPTPALQECARALKSGYINGAGEKDWYESIEEAAARGPTIKRTVEVYGVKDLKRTLLPQLYAVDKGLTTKTRWAKRQLSAAECAARVEAARALLAKPHGWLTSVVWIHCKHGRVMPAAHKAFCDVTTEDNGEFLISAPYFKRPKHVVVYAAVNAILGPVYFCYCTGTSGLKTGMKVRYIWTSGWSNFTLYIMEGRGVLRARCTASAIFLPQNGRSAWRRRNRRYCLSSVLASK